MKFEFPIEKVSKYIPSVEKPIYKQGINSRLKWTGVALLCYFVLSAITVYGLDQSANFEQYRFYEIVLGSKFGSLLTLGIGPIVTAGILLQLLVGSKIIEWDTTKPEEREKFQMWSKFLSVVLCFVEALAFVLAGTLPVSGGFAVKAFVVIQLAAGAIIVMQLDELVSKWGFGSGISLFIAAGVGSQILIRVLSPFTISCIPGNIISCLPGPGNSPNGLLWTFIIGVFSNDASAALDSFLLIFFTGVIFVIVVYIQNIRVEIPLSFASMRGFGRSWALKLLYTSNIPVILTAAVVANVQLGAQMMSAPTDDGLLCSFLGCFDESRQPINGVIYYITAPRAIVLNIAKGAFGLPTTPVTGADITRAVTYTLFMSLFAMVFSMFWVGTSGMDAEAVADQLQGIGLQIPGYRRDKTIMKNVLNRYIPYLALMGGLVVGMIAALADFTGALGTGTGMLLTTMIVYNYYEEVSSQRLDEAHPLVRKVFGED